jgi:Sec-independent protein translocase protein TatA
MKGLGKGVRSFKEGINSVKEDLENVDEKEGDKE